MPKKLLLADDSVTIQKVIGISFANEDVTLVTVDNGDDAIAKTRELRPDLVLADVVMPGKTGYEVCEAIKSDSNLSHIPVLLLTGTFEAFDEERARQVGAAGHVAKPFEAQTLVNQVKQLLEASAGAPPEAEELQAAEAPIGVVAESTDESFDFFSEDLSSGEPISATPVAETIVEDFAVVQSGDVLDAGEDLEIGNSLDLGTDLAGQEEAFSFGDDAFPEAGPEAVPVANALELDSSARVESTVAILPDDDRDIFSTAQTPANDLETLTTELVEPDFAAQGDDLLSIEADPLEPNATMAIEADATTTLLDDGPDVLGADMVDLAQATVLDPASASGFDVSSSDFDVPSTSPAVPTPIVEAPSHAASPPAHNEPPRAALGPDDSRAALDAVVPKLREQLHDTLEKVAWESFGSITEEIVRQAVDRVEAVAWEVIPQIAETLIQEEIRKMKGEE